ncbi:MAG: hypothetical protein P8M78_14845, partial [Myxococcota bacterium]|nr:hypothetical protein [Myxococcota bacterium]
SFESAQQVVGGSETGEGTSVAEISAAARIRALARSHSDLSGVGLKRIDAALRQIQLTIFGRALQLSPRSLDNALEAARIENRGGLLALLEILIRGAAAVALQRQSRGLSRVILRTVVALCRPQEGVGSRVACDPIFLSPSFHGLCSQVEPVEDSESRILEMEFFTAANLEAAALAETQGLIHRQKLIDSMEFQVFSPRILRAVVTYEVALASIDPRPQVETDELGQLETDSSRRDSSELNSSVFMSQPLRALGNSLAGRIGGAPRSTTPEGRIAWAIDLEGLRATEHEALRSEQLATAADPLGTTILIGLLGRQEKILGVELQDIGIPPAHVSGSWREELTGVLQKEIHAALKREAYGLSCAVSDLKARFLGDGGAALGPSEAEPSKPHSEGAGFKVDAVAQRPAHAESARSLVEAALRQPTVKLAGGLHPHRKRSTLGRLAIVLVLGLATITSAWFFASGGSSGIQALPSEELQFFSPYLTSGGRNLYGAGPAFVGRFDHRWRSMERHQRRAAAESLVARLRENGISQIVIRDENDRVRLQALGRQPVRLL